MIVVFLLLAICLPFIKLSVSQMRNYTIVWGKTKLLHPFSLGYSFIVLYVF